MKIALLGDIALVGHFDINESDYQKRISNLKRMLSGCDYIVANLESPLTTVSRTLVCKSMHIRSNPRNVKILRDLGVNAVSLANNHVLDFGVKGLEDTIQTLTDNGIKWYGVNGKTLKVSRNNEMVSFSGFCCWSANGVGYRRHANRRGVNLLTKQALREQLKQDQKQGFFPIMSLHWGIEHTNYPPYEYIQLMSYLSKEYRFIVHGHHPHQIQGIGKHNDSLVAYSLGNALFDDTSSLNKTFTVKMNDENRKSFIWIIDVINGMVHNTQTIGFYNEEEKGIVPYDIQNELMKYSSAITEIQDVDRYEQMRGEQYKNTIASKFGKHDIHWVKSRLNYYSIGAKITSVINHKRYLKEKERMLNGE